MSLAAAALLRVFLDCSGFGCYLDYLREEVDFVQYVRDRSDADVHVLITTARTGAGGREYTLSFIGQGTFAATTRSLAVTTENSASDDQRRRALASTLTVGLLGYVAGDSLPPSLTVNAEIDDAAAATAARAVIRDRWNRWIFSVDGDLALTAEESQRERDWGVSFSADRITPDWKLTMGGNFSQSRDEFDLDSGATLSVERRNRSFDGLSVWSLGEHWSVGAGTEIDSSTFNNTALDLFVAPAIEWNFFPYSMYTRRQLRALYALGAAVRRYYEETLFGKREETRTRQEVSVTYEQREPWGTLEGRTEWRNYFPGVDTHRFSIEAEADIRIARGFSIRAEGSASRIRDQLSLPRRQASSEEVLLRLRQLRSGFETRVEVGLRYQFGSAFASIVNPRFGR